MFDLPEMPEVKYDGACQICHGDHTKCDGKCAPQFKLPCVKHEWVYDDKDGGYCDVCGLPYPEPARKRATLQEIKERHSTYTSIYHHAPGGATVLRLPFNQADQDMSDLIAELEAAYRTIAQYEAGRFD